MNGMEHKKIPFSGAIFVPFLVWFILLVFLEPSNRLVDGRVLTNNKVVCSTYRTILCMTDYMAIWMVYDTIYHCKKCMTQCITSCMTQNMAAIFFCKKCQNRVYDTKVYDTKISTKVTTFSGL